MVDTGHVPRRVLHFETVEEVLAEAGRMAQLAREGKAAYSGNWDVGQILNHLAVWAEFAYGGNPSKPPFMMKVLGRVFKGYLLKNGLPAGKSIPNVPGGTHGTEKVPVDQALARMTAAFTRLTKEVPPEGHAVFGKMTQGDYIALNLRHAELHMSFVRN